jgi:hypothetical protein
VGDLCNSQVGGVGSEEVLRGNEEEVGWHFGGELVGC